MCATASSPCWGMRRMAESLFSNLAHRLLKGGVAPKHVRRTISELSDHFADIKAEALLRGLSETEATQEATKRIGSQEAIVADILAKPELKSWAARWPWAVFTLGPVLLGISFLVAVLLLFVSITKWWRVLLPDLVVTEASLAAMRVSFQALEYLWAPLAAGLMCLYASRRLVDLKWQVLGASVAAILCFFVTGFDLIPNLPVPEAGPVSGTIVYGLGYSSGMGDVLYRLATKVLPTLSVCAAVHVITRKFDYV